MSLARILIFLSIVLGIVGGVHFYFWLRLVRDTQLPFPYRPWAGGALIVLAACLPLPFLLGRRLPPDVAGVLLWPAFIWMGLMFLLFVLLVATDLVRLLAILSAKVGTTLALDPERRTFLARLLGGVAGLGAGAVGTVAIRQGLRAAEVKKVTVQLARLPRAADGTTVVQLTDLHIGATLRRAFVEDIVRRSNELQPDIVAITGDLVDGSVELLWDAVEPLGQLRARHGVFFVTGNHEYFSGVEPWMAALGRLGIRVLANERVAIGNGADGFDLAGVHDYSGAADRARAPLRPRRGPGRPRSAARADPAGPPAQERGGGGQAGRGAAAVRPHARRAALAVHILRAAGPAVRRRPASPRRHPDLRQPRHRLLGSAHAPGHAGGDHAHHPVEHARGLSLRSLR